MVAKISVRIPPAPAGPQFIAGTDARLLHGVPSNGFTTAARPVPGLTGLRRDASRAGSSHPRFRKVKSPQVLGFSNRSLDGVRGRSAQGWALVGFAGDNAACQTMRREWLDGSPPSWPSARRANVALCAVRCWPRWVCVGMRPQERELLRRLPVQHDAADVSVRLRSWVRDPIRWRPRDVFWRKPIDGSVRWWATSK